MPRKSLRVSVEPVLRPEPSRTHGASLGGNEEDRPPLVEFRVGRDSELRQIEGSSAKVIFLTGISGEGKSTLAARYFSDSRSSKAYDHFVCRDCKEESERFEIQLALVVHRAPGQLADRRAIPGSVQRVGVAGNGRRGAVHAQVCQPVARVVGVAVHYTVRSGHTLQIPHVVVGVSWL
jgi:hypothetical protein